MKKTFALVFALVILVAVAVGGTIAWLTDTTGEVQNTFTVGNIDIDLNESSATDPSASPVTENSYKMIPGATINKDPKVTVYAGSEKCWVFVEVTESDNLGDFISYTVDSGWTALEGVAGVYYREQASLVDATNDAVYSVLTGDKVTVNNTVTKEMMDAITAGTADEPTLTFKAYAIQYDNLAYGEADEGLEQAKIAWNTLNA